MLKMIPLPRLLTTEYRTLSRIRGPLIFVERTANVAYNEIVEIIGPDHEVRLGQVMEVDQQRCMIRIFIGTSGLDLDRTRARFTGDVARIGASLSMLGRVLNGSGQAIDGVASSGRSLISMASPLTLLCELIRASLSKQVYRQLTVSIR
jgi:vacuolar-type H+-ATPase subunit B/Vma2